MSKLSGHDHELEIQPKSPVEESPASSTNLVLIYSLIALALLTAIGLAILIVLPFYHRR